MQTRSIAGSRGLLRGAMLLVLLVLLAFGGAWWWFLGRFRLPEQAPVRAGSASSVLDYAGKRDLGLDPLEAMVKPALSDVQEGGVEAKLHFTKWSGAYAEATLARTAWKAADALGVVIDEVPSKKYRLDYLHQAQLAEYWRARYQNALAE